MTDRSTNYCSASGRSGRVRITRWLLIAIGIYSGLLVALLEEVITTSMTNLAPRLGTTPEEAHTTSTDYFVVVCFLSVVVCVPMFVAWAWMLGRCGFSPLKVLLLFGITGSIAKASMNPAIHRERVLGHRVIRSPEAAADPGRRHSIFGPSFLGEIQGRISKFETKPRIESLMRNEITSVHHVLHWVALDCIEFGASDFLLKIICTAFPISRPPHQAVDVRRIAEGTIQGTRQK